MGSRGDFRFDEGMVRRETTTEEGREKSMVVMMAADMLSSSNSHLLILLDRFFLMNGTFSMKITHIKENAHHHHHHRHLHRKLPIILSFDLISIYLLD